MEQQFTPNLQDCVSMRSLMKAMWGCASQLWVPGRSCVPGSPFLNICPKNSATIQFQVLMSMQMDACFRKERIGTHFVWVGALDGGFGRRVVSQWCPPQKVDMPSTQKRYLLMIVYIFVISVSREFSSGRCGVTLTSFGGHYGSKQ